MASELSAPKETINETDRYISDNARLVGAAADGKQTVHISQSFSGTAQTSAVVVCFVTCPDAIVLEMQQAIDEAVLQVLDEHGCKPLTIQ